MPPIRNTPEFKNKINELHTRLMGNPSKEELESMQLHIDALDKLARVSDADPYHNHDQNDHHDHTIVADLAQDIDQLAAKKQIP